MKTLNLNKEIIEDWITKMQLAWEMNDKVRLPEVIYRTWNQALLIQKQEFVKIIKEVVNELNKKSPHLDIKEVEKILLKELGEIK